MSVAQEAPPRRVPRTAPQTTSSFEPESLPRGQIHRVLVEVIHDALGHPVYLPMMVARGAKPGPVFGLTAAVHGNELNGIPLIHRLFDRLDPKQLRGTLAAVMVVNIPGFIRHQRRFMDGRDLNHIMPGKEGGRASDVYASRFVRRILERFDYLVDLHTASFGRINSLYVRADMTHPTTAQMAYLQRPQIILHDPPSDHTVRGHAMELGIPAITLEIGNPQRFQPEYIRRSLVGLRAVLAAAGMVRPRKVSLGDPPVLCHRSYWIYTDHGGLLEVHPGVVDVVEPGEDIARLVDVFGEVTRTYRAPERGVVIGRSSNPVGQTGARILHLGLLADPRDGPFLPRLEPADFPRSDRARG